MTAEEVANFIIKEWSFNTFSDGWKKLKDGKIIIMDGDRLNINLSVFGIPERNIGEYQESLREGKITIEEALKDLTFSNKFKESIPQDQFDYVSKKLRSYYDSNDGETKIYIRDIVDLLFNRYSLFL